MSDVKKNSCVPNLNYKELKQEKLVSDLPAPHPLLLLIFGNPAGTKQWLLNDSTSTHKFYSHLSTLGSTCDQ